MRDLLYERNKLKDFSDGAKDYIRYKLLELLGDLEDGKYSRDQAWALIDEVCEEEKN